MRVIVLAIVLAGNVAWADAPGQTPPFSPIEVHLRPLKSETTATALTLGGVALPFVLTYLTYVPNTDNPMYAPIGGLTGLLLPAMGHWYTGHAGTYGVLMRLGGLTLAMAGLSMIDDADRCARGEPVTDGCAGSDRNVGRVSLALGLAGWVGSWVYDLMSARHEVRRHNRRFTVQIVPQVGSSTGFAVGGTF